MENTVGFWPGEPDKQNYEREQIDIETYLEQVARFADYLTAATLFSMSFAPDWKLLMTYQPEIDEVEHEFLLTDPQQPGYSTQASHEFAEHVQRAYQIADDNIAQIARDGSASNLVIVSDHGMSPLHTTVFVNRVLRDNGVVVNKDNVTDSGYFESPQYLGQHGYDSTLSEMHAIFIAAGPNIADGLQVGPVKLIDIAPTVAQILGFSLPDADGHVLNQILTSADRH